MLERLSALEMWSAGGIVVRRRVKLANRQVFGKDESGFIVLKEVGPRLQIFVGGTAASRGSLPIGHLCDRLKQSFSIPEIRAELLMGILASDNDDAIKDLLERADLLPNDFDCFDQGPEHVTPVATGTMVADPEPEPIITSVAPWSKITEQPDSSMTTCDQSASPSAQSQPTVRLSQPTKAGRSSENIPNPSTRTLDVARINSAVGSFDTAGIGALSTTAAPTSAGARLTVQPSVNRTVSPSSLRNSGSRSGTNTAFDTTRMRSAPNVSYVRSSDTTGMAASLSFASPPALLNDDADPWGQEIGYGGELFVSHVFQHNDTTWHTDP